MKSGDVPHWIEYAKLLLMALIPIAVAYLGMQLDRGKAINQELVKKRVALYDSICPKLNDIFVFSQGIGHWSKLDPFGIIERKREIDRDFHVNRYIFSEAVFSFYEEFEKAFFHLYQGPGQAAKLRVDLPALRRQIGQGLKPEWESSLSHSEGSRSDQLRTYNNLVRALALEIRRGR